MRRMVRISIQNSTLILIAKDESTKNYVKLIMQYNGNKRIKIMAF